MENVTERKGWIETNFKTVIVILVIVLAFLNTWFGFQIIEKINDWNKAKQVEYLLYGFNSGVEYTTTVNEKYLGNMPNIFMTKGKIKAKYWFSESVKKLYNLNILQTWEENSEEYKDITNTVGYADDIDREAIFVKASFPAPESARLTSGFGMRRNVWMPKVTADAGGMLSNQVDHPSIDIGLRIGDPVYATLSGTVLKSGTFRGYGNVVMLYHSYVFDGKLKQRVSMYSHLNKTLVKSGEYVEKSELIGKAGESGIATGSHLDFQIIRLTNEFNSLKDVEKFVEIYCINDSTDLAINPLRFFSGSDWAGVKVD